jgi:hypothetical protein
MSGVIACTHYYDRSKLWIATVGEQTDHRLCAYVVRLTSWRKVEETPEPQFETADKPLKMLALPRRIELLFSP